MRIKYSLLVMLLIIGIANSSTQAASSNVDLKGTLVAEPCNIVVGNDGDNVVVDFGTIAEKTFYSISSRRTWLQPFHIQLEDCDLSLGKEVKLTFTGTADDEQDGLLAITSNTGVGHIAIGLQTATGAKLLFNKQTDAYPLNKGKVQLDFKAYVQASDEGVRNKNVGRGTFDAISTFELEYP